MNEKRLCTMIGFAMRAGKLLVGTELVLHAMQDARQRQKIHLVLSADDSSEGTKKKLRTKAEFYNIIRCELPFSRHRLSELVGKEHEVAAIAVLDSGFAKEIMLSLENYET